ncbi:MAG: hypothetical protein SGCHY_000806 [Lobulomycetales sp.]
MSQKLVDALNKRNGIKALKVLRSHAQMDTVALASDPKWLEIIQLRNQVARDIKATDYPAIAALLNKQAQAFHNIFPTYGKWSLPLLYYFNETLMQVSIKADKLNPGSTCLEEAVRTVYKAFSACITDRFSPPHDSRKWGTYRITILLLSSYFRLGSINLCANIQAEENLAFALANTCDRGNKHAILKYLVPLRMKRGKFPHPKLLASFYDLKSVYSPFIDAIKKGNIKEFDSRVDAAEQRLIAWGVFRVILEARNLCLRVLFKKIFLIMDSQTKLPMQLFCQGMNVLLKDGAEDEEFQPLDTECVLANLIDRGLIKGYLSHEKQMVVLSAKDPFPAVKV